MGDLAAVLKAMAFDDDYREAPALFGAEPEPILCRFADQLPPERPVVDVGAGQGRHALWLAQRGFRVDAIDPSQVAVETIAESASSRGLPVRARRAGFDDLEAEPGEFGGVLLFGLIQILTRTQIARLVECVERWTAPGSLVFATGFTTGDPAYERHVRDWTSVGERSFSDGRGNLRTYMEPGELPRLFGELEVLHCWEGLGPEHRHGDRPPERHGMVEAVFRRR